MEKKSLIVQLEQSYSHLKFVEQCFQFLEYLILNDTLTEISLSKQYYVLPAQF